MMFSSCLRHTISEIVTSQDWGKMLAHTMGQKLIVDESRVVSL